ncbi:TPA: diguanylate cyclase, partial [Citrobacter braakii]
YRIDKASSLFDTNTIILIIEVISASLSALVAWIVLKEKERAGLCYWSMALAIHSVVFYLFSLRGKAPDFLSIVIANAGLACVYSILFSIVVKFSNSPKIRLLIHLTPALIILSIFPFIINETNLRIGFGGVVFSIQHIMILFILIRSDLTIEARSKYLLIIGCLIILAIHIIRVICIIFNPSVIPEILSQSPLQSLTFIAILLSIVLITNGIMLSTALKQNNLYKDLAFRDKLTGISNRYLLELRGGSEINKCRLGDYSSALIIIDIDNFKSVNDTYGHLTGDQVLKEITTLIASCLNPEDVFGRWGGEEFIIIFPDTDMIHALMQTEYIRSSIDSHLFPQVREVTASFGISISDKSDSWDSWIERADKALYKAKLSGKNRVDYNLIEVNNNFFIKDFMKLTWLPIYNTGLEHIDNQHRRLFESANFLIEKIISSSENKDCSFDFVNTIFNDIVTHFKDEEKVMCNLGYPDSHKHALSHNKLTEKATSLIMAGNKSGPHSGDLYQYLVYEVIAWHILVEDRKFAEWLSTNNI